MNILGHGVQLAAEQNGAVWFNLTKRGNTWGAYVGTQGKPEKHQYPLAYYGPDNRPISLYYLELMHNVHDHMWLASIYKMRAPHKWDDWGPSVHNNFLSALNDLERSMPDLFGLGRVYKVVWTPELNGDGSLDYPDDFGFVHGDATVG